MFKQRSFSLANVLGAGFNWSGRTGRGLFMAAAVPVGLLIFVLTAHATINSLHPAYRAGMLLMGLVLVPTLGQVRRRLRDAGLSGWLMWLLLLPFVRLLFVLTLAIIPPRETRYNKTTKSQRPGIVVACVLAVFVASQYFWAPLLVRSDHMAPTLQMGDVLLARPMSGDAVARGDIIAFQRMSLEPVLIGRVAAVAGDRIELRQGRVILNGTPLEVIELGEDHEPFEKNWLFDSFPACSNLPEMGEDCVKMRLRETLPGGRSYEIFDLGETIIDGVDEVTLGEGELYMLDDHRDNALDSRMPREMFGAGIVNVDEVQGRIRHVLFSLAGGRIWKSVE